MSLNAYLKEQRKELRELRIEVNSLIVFIVRNAIENAQSSEERHAVLNCWEEVSAMSLGGKVKAEGEGKAKGSKAQSTADKG